ncbi:MAG: hypothetical protein KF691_14075 [Phycisphaeraceae bacterium]|nr:hypothetical protein [Phycisphaeraceae bacterium]
MNVKALWSGAVCLQVVAATALGVGREACTKTRNVASATIRAIRCIKDDTKVRGLDGSFMAPWSDTITGFWNSTPDDPTSAITAGHFTVAPGVPSGGSQTGSLDCWIGAEIHGVLAPSTRVELSFTYAEPIVTTEPSTLRFKPHNILPGVYHRVTLSGPGGVLAIRDIVGADVLLSVATPGTYTFETESTWTSSDLPIGSSEVISDTMSIRNALEVGASCPADLTVDQQVDDADFVGFSGAYNILDCADPAMPQGCPADLNLDGFVDDTDFVIFAAAYDALLCE